MNYLKDLIVKKFLLSWLKGKLDSLPFDGWKTVIGIVEVALGVLLVQVPEYHSAIQFALDILNQLGGNPITDMGVVTLIKGIVTTLIGLVHKLLKKKAEHA